jgi:hypothetical protein
MTPTTTPEVRYEREKQATEQTDHVALEVKEIKKLYDRTAQLWKNLEEDERIQQWDKKEDKLNTSL